MKQTPKPLLMNKILRKTAEKIRCTEEIIETAEIPHGL